MLRLKNLRSSSKFLGGPPLLLFITATVARAFSTPYAQIRSIHLTCLQSSTSTIDLWNAEYPISQAQQQQREQASSNKESSILLPLPELADDPSIAERARQAMSTNASLKRRCNVNLDEFNNGRCKAQWLHVDPPVLIVDNFLTERECDDILRITISPPPAGVGRVIKLESRLSQANEANNRSTAVRRSTTWYVRYGAPQLAPLLRNLLQLLPDIQLEQTEEVQLVRYMGEGQGFGWHQDTLSEEEATFQAGGQRIATLLVYLDECQDGSGRTLFRDLRGRDHQRLGVSPKKGRALLFFPAISATQEDDLEDALHHLYEDGTYPDRWTVHAGEPPIGQKNIVQLWIHSGVHTPVVFGRGLNKHSEAVL